MFGVDISTGLTYIGLGNCGRRCGCDRGEDSCFMWYAVTAGRFQKRKWVNI